MGNALRCDVDFLPHFYVGKIFFYVQITITESVEGLLSVKGSRDRARSKESPIEASVFVHESPA